MERRSVPEIDRAVGLLEKAERAMPSCESAEDYKEAFDLLNYLPKSAELSGELSTYIANVKNSHARRILERVCEIDPSNIEQWFPYILLVMLTLKKEVAMLRLTHPDLGESFDRFAKTHRDEMLEILQ